MRKTPNLMSTGGDFGTTEESFQTEDTDKGIYSGTYRGQTWLTTSAYTIRKVRVYASCSAAWDGNFTVAIRATSGGLPTGANLTSGSVGKVSAGPNGIKTQDSWVTITLTPYALSNATTYAIVCYTDDAVNACVWRADSAAGYASGQAADYTGGGPWTADASFDQTFETVS